MRINEIVNKMPLGEPVHLKTFVSSYGHTAALRNGTVTVPGVTFEFANVSPMIAAYRSMVRDLAFDVCELAPTTYLVAKAFGAPFTALPVFLNRMFHFGDIQCRTEARIAAPAGLAGRRVGVRAYTVTSGVWMRGILQHEFGVLPESITWVTDDEEHVREFRPPPNVVAAPAGRSLVDLLDAGEIEAAFGGNAGVGRAGAPRAGWERPKVVADVVPLFPDAGERDRAWYVHRGIYPIHGVVVVKDDLLAADPTLAQRLYAAFVRAKEAFLPGLDAKWTALRDVVGRDPLPYGIAANRVSLDALIAFSHEQGLIPTRWEPEDVFIPCAPA